jgi:hypothetical protein
MPRVHPVVVHLNPKSSATAGCRAITAAPISPDGDSLDDAAGPTLDMIADVRPAPWLGPDGIFLIDAEKAAELRGLGRLAEALDLEDIDQATETVRRTGRFVIVTDKDEEPVGALSRHLIEEGKRMPPRGKRSRYWMPPETIYLDLSRPSLLVPRIAQRIRVVDIRAGLLPHNHNITLQTTTDLVSLDEIKALLLSADSQAWLRRNAQRLENDFFFIASKLLRRLPLPAHMAQRLLPLAA